MHPAYVSWRAVVELTQRVEPELRLVRLFDYDAQSRRKLLIGPATPSGAVIRSHACPCAEQLGPDELAQVVLSELQAEPHNIQCEPPRSLSEFVGIHGSRDCKRQANLVICDL